MEKRIIELYRRKFDDIRHEADGIEYWYARELMKLLDYQHLPLPQKILQLK